MTIEERAREFANMFAEGDTSTLKSLIHNVAKDGYIIGACDQRKVDIDKACECLKNHVGSAYIDMGKVGLSECHCQDWWLEEFCKAMEEDV